MRTALEMSGRITARAEQLGKFKIYKTERLANALLTLVVTAGAYTALNVYYNTLVSLRAQIGNLKFTKLAGDI